MAVVLIIALIAAIVAPRLSRAASQAVLDDGRQLAATLDFARGKAVAAGRPFRVVLDLDAGQYWIESKPAPAQSPPVLAWADVDPLPLAAPRAQDTSFSPLPGTPGRPTPLRANVKFAGVETDRGDVVEGDAAIEFASDGATPAARVWLAGGDEARAYVDVAALADPTQVSLDAAP